MTKFPSITTTAIVVLLSGLFVSNIHAAPDEEQRLQLQALKLDIRKTSNFLKRGMIAESVELVRDIQSRMEKLGTAGDAEVTQELQDLAESLAISHGLLELEGYTLKPLTASAMAPSPMMMANDPAVPGTPAPAPAPLPTTFPTANISFTKHVAPILIARCGNCHVTGSRGGFSANTFEALMQGPAAGKVIFPGDDIGSRLIETIETGDMPRGGGSVRPPELTALKTWVKEGAKYDGLDPKAPINQAGAANPAAMMELEVAAATGNEQVSFGLDVAGVLANRCVNCHSGNNPPGGLGMDNFARFIRGGDSGAPFVPGKPEDSMIVRLIKATGNGRMPRNGPPLTGEQIAKIETWIREGGKFDGESPNDDSMMRINQIALAKKATHEQLAAMRAESSQQMWDLGMPNVQSAKVDSTNFLAYGTMGQATLQELVADADKAADKVRTILKIPTTTPLVKGKMTLYFFQKRYDYAEFGNMIERRDLPADWKGHYRYNVTDAYGSIQVPSDGEYDLEVLLGQLIASSHIASLGNGTVPDWFAEGAGRVVASRMSKKDPRVVEWDNQIESALGSMSKPDDFVMNRLSPDQASIASYAFMKAIMGRGNSYDAMMNSLRKGTNFDEAFQSAFNMTPSQLAAAWAASGR
ncbi:c-type cytochrome domain-containing protein [Bremerella volcania]|uniref:c-type cytochrome domain-containing protein n=1 Tax=Bremerella volcania TaxID=2527984 RepID=UPI0013FCF80C|nr:c-type cytochrome domain-containing protein [Bremerella volcania]